MVRQLGPAPKARLRPFGLLSVPARIPFSASHIVSGKQDQADPRLLGGHHGSRVYGFGLPANQKPVRLFRIYTRHGNDLSGRSESLLGVAQSTRRRKPAVVDEHLETHKMGLTVSRRVARAARPSFSSPATCPALSILPSPFDEGTAGRDRGRASQPACRLRPQEVDGSGART